MTTKSMGDEGFRWFIGVVEDRDDPLQLGRMRVRIYNLHSLSQSFTSTSDLPWAQTMNSVNDSNLSKVGRSPTGIQVGTTVIGFFMDGRDGNVPVIMGSLAGIPDNNIVNHDISFEARGTNTIVKPLLGTEPSSAYNAKYPYNKVMRTESGHVIEIDDTPDNERIHWYHKSGTYTEIDHDGRMVTKVVNDDYQVVAGNREVYIEGNVNVRVNGSYTLSVSGPIVINGSTVNINSGTMGAARIGDIVPDTEIDGTQGIKTGSRTVFIGG
jgi:hypothetical protein